MKRPLMGAGIALVAGVAAAFLGVPWFGVCLGLAGLNIGIKIWAESSFKYVLGLSAFLIVGFCRTLPEVLDPADFSSSGPTIQGSVCRVQKKANSTWIYVRTREKEEVLVMAANDSEGEAEYYKGQIIEIWGEAEAFASPGNPGQFDEKSYYLSQGVSCRVWAEKIVLVSEGRWFWRQLRFLEVLKERMSVFYRESMSESGAGVVLAAVLGDRSGFTEDLRRYYQENGWMHLVTTSGLHLSFIAMGLYRRLRKSTVAIWPSTVLALLAMLTYGYMTDFGDSMLRAMGMMIFSLIGRLLGRKNDMSTALVLTADVLLLFRPARLFSAGFQLSFGAVAGMILGKYLEKCFLERERHSKSKTELEFQSVFWIQAGIFFATLPVLLWHMYEIPLLGFFYNFFMIPLISFVVPAAFIAGLMGSCLVPGLTGAASVIMGGIDVLFGWVHRLPSAMLVCGRPQWWQIGLFCICAGGAVCLAGRNRFHFVGLMAAGCLILMFVRERSDRIICIDVGQGDGLCILSEQGQAVLVDGGSSDVKKVYQYRIEPMLKYYGVRKIDAWFLTHGDSDHVSGLREALENSAVPVKQVILPDVSADETLNEICDLSKRQAVSVMIIRPEDRLKAGNFEFLCLYPKAEWCSGDKNNDSLVLSLSRTAGENYFTMLLMGDLERQGEEMLLEKNGVSDCDVLKVGHHGSSGATSKVFLEASAPEWAFISCGENNSYGHPHDETLERLRMAGCEYLTTAGHGALMIQFSLTSYHILVWGKGADK